MKIADAVEIGNKADLNELESPGFYRVNDEQKFTYKQTQEIFVEALNSNAYLNMCECSDMINAIKALEKQIPFKPKEYEDRFYACKCGNILLMKWEKYPTELMPKSEGLPYCLACGQKLDWR